MHKPALQLAAADGRYIATAFLTIQCPLPDDFSDLPPDKVLPLAEKFLTDHPPTVAVIGEAISAALVNVYQDGTPVDAMLPASITRTIHQPVENEGFILVPLVLHVPVEESLSLTEAREDAIVWIRSASIEADGIPVPHTVLCQ